MLTGDAVKLTPIRLTCNAVMLSDEAVTLAMLLC